MQYTSYNYNFKNYSQPTPPQKNCSYFFWKVKEKRLKERNEKGWRGRGGGLIVNIFFGAEIFFSGDQIFLDGVEKFSVGVRNFQEGLRFFREGLGIFREELRFFREGLKFFWEGLKFFRRN